MEEIKDLKKHINQLGNCQHELNADEVLSVCDDITNILEKLSQRVDKLKSKGE